MFSSSNLITFTSGIPFQLPISTVSRDGPPRLPPMYVSQWRPLTMVKTKASSATRHVIIKQYNLTFSRCAFLGYLFSVSFCYPFLLSSFSPHVSPLVCSLVPAVQGSFVSLGDVVRERESVVRRATYRARGAVRIRAIFFLFFSCLVNMFTCLASFRVV